MANVGSLIVTLEASTASFASSMSKASQLSFDTAKSIERSWKIIGAATTAAIGATVAGLAAMTDAAINSADRMGKLSQAAGLSVESFSGLAYAAKLSDVSTETLSSSLVILSKNLEKSNQLTLEGKAAHSALELIFRGSVPVFKTTDDAFKAIAEQLSKLPDGYQKSALAAQVFGRAGAGLIPLLNQGAAGIEAATNEAKLFGVVVSDQVAKQAEHFVDNLTKLKTASEGFATSIAAGVLPALDAITDGLVAVAKAAEKNKGFWDSAYIVASGEVAADELVQVLTLTEALAAAQKKLTPLPPPGALDPKAFAGTTEIGQKTIADLQFQLQLFGQSAGEAERLKAMRAGALQSEQGIIQALATQLDLLGKHAALLKDRAKDFYGPLHLPKVPEFKPVDVTAPDIGLPPLPNIDLTSLGGVKLSDEIKKITDSLNSDARPAIDKYVEGLEQIQLLSANGLNADAVSAAVKELGENLGIASKQLNSWAPIAAETRFALEDLFSTGILHAGGFKDALAGVLEQMAQMILRLQVLDPLMNKLFGAENGGGGSGGGGILGSILGGLGGLFGGGFNNGLDPLNIGILPLTPRAAGGPVGAGQPLLIGERGPEVFVPDVSGRIMPNGALNGTTISQVFQIDARGADAGVEDRIYRAMRKSLDAYRKLAVNDVIERQRRTA